MADIRDTLRELGIKNPDSPNAEDLRKIFSLLLESKKISKEMFNKYCDTIAPSLEVVFSGLKAFCESQQKSSDKYLEIIREAINILGRELQRDLTFEEREKILDRIKVLALEARDEADKQRSFLLNLAKYGALALSCIGTIAVAIAFGGKDKGTQDVNTKKTY